MNKDLLSITDENAILITLEFLESGKILKVGDEDEQKYELDIIVKNDITCDQLLKAVGENLIWKLRSWGIDIKKNESFRSVYTARRPYDQDICVAAYRIAMGGKKASGELEEIRLENMDSRHPDVATETELSVRQRRMKKLESLNLLNFFQQRRLERERAYVKAELERQAQEASADASCLQGDAGRKSDKRTDDEKMRDAYLICWCVFQRCYRAYQQELKKRVEPKEHEKIRDGTPREPVIGIGSINYNKIPDGAILCWSDGAQIHLRKDRGGMTLRENGFITSTRVIFDPWGWHNSAALFDPTAICVAFRDRAPDYNIGERPLRRFDDEPIHIIPPTDPPQKDRQSILTTILSPLLMTGTMIATRVLFSGGVNGMSVAMMTSSMGLVSVLVAVINLRIRNSDHKKSVEEWKTQYEAYIQRLLADIRSKQTDDIKKLNELYPPAIKKKQKMLPGESEDGTEHSLAVTDLVTKALYMDGDIFSRGQEHPDYLAVRIGVSTKTSELVPSVFQILGEKKEAVYASIRYQNIQNVEGSTFEIVMPKGRVKLLEEPDNSHYLIDLPVGIAQEYAYLKDAPVMLRLKECGTLGIVFDQAFDFTPFLSNLLLDLCFYHSPDDLQCVMLCQETKDHMRRQEIIRRFKHLPHFRELLGDLSAFAFEKGDAYLIFNKLLEILTERRKADTEKFPHILLIVLEEHGLKRHPVSEYLSVFGQDSKKQDTGISFIFCKCHEEDLPKYCGQVIKRTVLPFGEEQWFLLPHVQMISRTSSAVSLRDENRYCFIPDRTPPIDVLEDDEKDISAYHRAFKMISALHYERIAQGAGVPGQVELFDIVGDLKGTTKEELAGELQAYIMNAWGLTAGADGRDTTQALKVPLGKKTDEVIIELDLHEKADGPHMLVAGTTGSGKTETILTFLVTLCANYSPEQVNLLLMDMKGAGFVQRIGEKENCLPHVVGTVTDIAGDETGTGTAYMLKRFLLSMNAEVKKRKLYLSRMGVDSVDGYNAARADLDNHLKENPGLDRRDLEDLPPLPHLFLVIDEFTELMSFGSDKDGVDFRPHITSLARIGRSLGFHIILISQNIENAITDDIRVNSRARLCLKVATREASRDMIRSDLAASPMMPGNGRAYLLVGTGSRFEYFQSGYSGAEITRNRQAPIQITQANTSGKYEVFYPPQEKKKEKKDPEQEEKKQETARITQLKIMVEQIRACDQKRRENSGWEPRRVFQPPLSNACTYDYDWTIGPGASLDLVLGRYDNPEEQKQEDYSVDLFANNLAIFGSAMCGKTTVLQTLLLRLHQVSRLTENEQIYILDFGNGLSRYKDLPYVTAYFDGTNEENVRRIFRTVTDAFMRNLRSKALQGKTYIQCNPKDRPPHITFIIDGLNAFMAENLYNVYHDTLQKLARDGLSKGISVIFTAIELTGDIRRILSSFKRIIALEMMKDAYSDLFGRNVEKPISTMGRGMANIGSFIYEFQGYTPFSLPNDSDKIDSATRKAISELEADMLSYGNSTKRFSPVPQENQDILKRCRDKKLKSFVSELTKDTWKDYRDEKEPADVRKEPSEVVLGLDYYSLQPVCMNFENTRSVAIYGGKSTGKTNLLSLILMTVKEHIPSTRFVLWDDGRNGLRDPSKAQAVLDVLSTMSTDQVVFRNSREEFEEYLRTAGYFDIPDSLSDIRGAKPLPLVQPNMDLFANPPKALDSPPLPMVAEPKLPGKFVKAQNPFTVFVIQSRLFYQVVPGGPSRQLIPRLAPFIADTDQANPKLFIFSDVPQISDSELNTYFNDFIDHAFLLNDILRFVNDKGRKSVFGRLDPMELKEQFGKCELGDGFYMNLEKEDLVKLKLLKQTL